MTATYSFLQTAGCLLFLLSTPETGHTTLLFTSRICPYLHCHVVRGTKVFVRGLNTPRSRISENNIPHRIPSAWLFSVEWHIFQYTPPQPTTAPISKETILFGWKVWIMTTALGKLELDTELRPPCKVSVWSRHKELLWYGSPKIHRGG